MLGKFESKHKTKIDYADTNSASYLTYKSWNALINRCLHKSEDKYCGTPVDCRWLNFDNFVEDMGMRPAKDHQIDRIDNTKGYSKDNCRWVNLYVQAANRRKTSSPTSSKYVGVSHRNPRWISYIHINKKMIYLGLFDTEDDAKDARNQYIIDNNLTEVGFALQ